MLSVRVHQTQTQKPPTKSNKSFFMRSSGKDYCGLIPSSWKWSSQMVYPKGSLSKTAWKFSRHLIVGESLINFHFNNEPKLDDHTQNWSSAIPWPKFCSPLLQVTNLGEFCRTSSIGLCTVLVTVSEKLLLVWILVWTNFAFLRYDYKNQTD